MQGPFSAEWSAEEAMIYLQNMRQQLRDLRDRESQLRNDLRLFDLSLFESGEMARLEKVLSFFSLYRLYSRNKLYTISKYEFYLSFRYVHPTLSYFIYYFVYIEDLVI